MIVKICKLLEDFSTADMTKLGKYIEYRSKAPNLQILFNYFLEERPNYDKLDKKAKEKIARKIFGNKENSTRTLHNIESKLLTCILDFIVAQQVESNLTKSHARQSHSKAYYFVLLEEYQKKGLNDDFSKLVNKLEKEWDLTLKEDVGIEHMQCLTRLWTMKINHPSSRPKEAAKYYKKIFITLDQYYFASKLYWTLTKANNERVVGLSEIEDFQTYPEDRIIEYINLNSEKFGPQNSLLAKISGIYYKQDVKEIQNLKTEILEKLKYFNGTEKTDLFQFLTDIVNNSSKIEMFERNRMLFELNKYWVEENLYDDQLEYDVFLSIVYGACAANELEWVEDFINKYNKKIIQADRKDTTYLSNAYIAFEKENYDLVLESLHKIERKDLVFNIRMRILKLLTFFKLENDTSFTAHANAFKGYINNRDDTSLSKPIKAFISFLEKTHKCRDRAGDKVALEELVREIESSPVVCKIFLIKILNDLIKNKK